MCAHCKEDNTIFCANIGQIHAQNECDISTHISLVVMAPLGFLETGQSSHQGSLTYGTNPLKFRCTHW